ELRQIGADRRTRRRGKSKGYYVAGVRHRRCRQCRPSPRLGGSEGGYGTVASWFLCHRGHTDAIATASRRGAAPITIIRSTSTHPGGLRNQATLTAKPATIMTRSETPSNLMRR